MTFSKRAKRNVKAYESATPSDGDPEVEIKDGTSRVLGKYRIALCFKRGEGIHAAFGDTFPVSSGHRTYDAVKIRSDIDGGEHHALRIVESTYSELQVMIGQISEHFHQIKDEVLVGTAQPLSCQTKGPKARAGDVVLCTDGLYEFGPTDGDEAIYSLIKTIPCAVPTRVGRLARDLSDRDLSALGASCKLHPSKIYLGAIAHSRVGEIRNVAPISLSAIVVASEQMPAGITEADWLTSRPYFIVRELVDPGAGKQPQGGAAEVTRHLIARLPAN